MQLPLKFEYSFKMNTLLKTTVKQGGVPVILTEEVLKKMARKTLYTLPGVIATDSSGAEVDIDILASCDGRLVCVECKTLKMSPKPSSIATIVKQLEKDYCVASSLEADVFAVSILSNNIPAKIANFVRKKNRQARGPFAIIIRLEDLERGFLLRTCVEQGTRHGIEREPIDIESLLSLGRANGFQA